MIGRYLNSDLYMKIDCIMTLLVGLVMEGLFFPWEMGLVSNNSLGLMDIRLFKVDVQTINAPT